MVWVFVIVVLLVVLLPGFWVKRVLQKYSEPADRYRGKGSGGELARHLLDRFELGRIGVEATERGDHYDPVAGVVRLSPQHYGGHSLAAVTVATHEVGHAIQHARGEPLFGFRQRIVRLDQSEDVAPAGLDLLQERNYDAVITDLSMPGMDGLQLTAEIKRLLPSMPVLVVSGWNSLDKCVESKDAQPDHVLSKPFSFDQLSDALLELLPTS